MYNHSINNISKANTECYLHINVLQNKMYHLKQNLKTYEYEFRGETFHFPSSIARQFLSSTFKNYCRLKEDTALKIKKITSFFVLTNAMLKEK